MLATKAVKAQGKGGVLATKAVETQGKSGVLPDPAFRSPRSPPTPRCPRRVPLEAGSTVSEPAGEERPRPVPSSMSCRESLPCRTASKGIRYEVIGAIMLDNSLCLLQSKQHRKQRRRSSAACRRECKEKAVPPPHSSLSPPVRSVPWRGPPARPAQGPSTAAPAEGACGRSRRGSENAADGRGKAPKKTVLRLQPTSVRVTAAAAGAASCSRVDSLRIARKGHRLSRETVKPHGKGTVFAAKAAELTRQRQNLNRGDSKNTRQRQRLTGGCQPTHPRPDWKGQARQGAHPPPLLPPPVESGAPCFLAAERQWQYTERQC